MILILILLFYRIDDREDYGEVRYRAFGFIDALLYTLIFTQTGETVRAISLRKTAPQEREIYAEDNY